MADKVHTEAKWPSEIEESYQRLRPLGQGGFGVVWLAKAKNLNKESTVPSSTAAPERRETGNTASTSVASDGPEGGDARESTDKKESDDESIDSFEAADQFDPGSAPLKSHRSPTNKEHPYVAIKLINTSHKDQSQYASREIAILSEINHPNVIRCLYSVHIPSPACELVVMTLADGPDLGKLVAAGGALSTSLARLAARHLIAAVSYLHGRGVIHRDIKPDNLILAKAGEVDHARVSDKSDWMSNDSLWDDKAVFSQKEWKVVLVDFGFAKALKPMEVGMHKSVRKLVNHSIKNSENDPPIEPGTPRTTRRSSSFARITIRSMSALGTRAFAAPEVANARDKSSKDLALTEAVADYGLVADAYSVGCTIKVLLTGVPAEEKDVMAFIGANDNPLANIISAIFSCGKKSDGSRKKRFKFLDETPKPAMELVGKLVKPKIEERLTVMMARDEPWVKGGLDENDPIVNLPQGDIPAGIDDPIVCLNCAVRH